MLETAKWRLLIIQHAVDRYAAGEDSRGYAARTSYIAAAYVGVKAKVRVVGDPDHIFFVFVSDDAQHGSEYLFPRDRHIIVHANEHSRFYEVTCLQPFGMAFAADQYLCSFLNAFANIRLHALILLLGHHGSDCGLGIGGFAGWKCRNSVQNCL